MMRAFALAALLTAGVATPALAQDRAPFTGPRVEGLVGWDRAQTNPGRDDGVTYGVAAGYDMQAGGAVVGIEGEASDSTIKECVRDVEVTGDRLCAKAGRDLYVGGRVGGVVGGNTLLYAKAGYTNARIKAEYDDGETEVSDGSNLDGVRVGAGAEHAIGPNSYVKGEYRYSNYEAGFSRHQVVGGFGFRF